jgi:hypothetical protein
MNEKIDHEDKPLLSQQKTLLQTAEKCKGRGHSGRSSLLGRTLEKHGRLREAREEFLKELQLDPTSAAPKLDFKELDSWVRSNEGEQ